MYVGAVACVTPLSLCRAVFPSSVSLLFFLSRRGHLAKVSSDHKGGSPMKKAEVGSTQG